MALIGCWVRGAWVVIQAAHEGLGVELTVGLSITALPPVQHRDKYEAVMLLHMGMNPSHFKPLSASTCHQYPGSCCSRCEHVASGGLHRQGGPAGHDAAQCLAKHQG